jgi:hypothetical protein
VVSVTPRPRFTPGERTPGTHWIGGWVGLRAGLDAGARRKILCPCRGSNLCMSYRGSLSEKVKRIMLDSHKWADQSKTLLHSLNYSVYNQTTIFTGIRQLEFAILQLQRQIQNVMMGLEGIFFWQSTYYFDSSNYFILDFEECIIIASRRIHTVGWFKPNIQMF